MQDLLAQSSFDKLKEGAIVPGVITEIRQNEVVVDIGGGAGPAGRLDGRLVEVDALDPGVRAGLGDRDRRGALAAAKVGDPRRRIRGGEPGVQVGVGGQPAGDLVREERPVDGALALAEVGPDLDLVALDGKVEIDENAAFRQPDMVALQEPEAEHPLEVRAREVDTLFGTHSVAILQRLARMGAAASSR